MPLLWQDVAVRFRGLGPSPAGNICGCQQYGAEAKTGG